MGIDITTEKRLEEDIESFFLSVVGEYTKNHDTYDPKLGLYVDTLIRFIKATQENSWKRFVMQNADNPERKFCLAFNNACDADGLIYCCRVGFANCVFKTDWMRMQGRTC